MASGVEPHSAGEAGEYRHAGDADQEVEGDGGGAPLPAEDRAGQVDGEGGQAEGDRADRDGQGAGDAEEGRHDGDQGDVLGFHN